MLKLEGSVCIEASQEATWTVLADIENIVDWSEMVQSAKARVKFPQVWALNALAPLTIK